MARQTRTVAKRDAEADIGARHAAHLRPLNLDRVLTFAIQQSRPFTRAEVIDATGLSARTVGTLCAHLIRRGVVTDVGTGPSRGGRIPGFIEVKPRYRFVARICIGPRQTRLSVSALVGGAAELRV